MIGNLWTRLTGTDGIGRPDDVPFEPFDVDGLTVRCDAAWPDGIRAKLAEWWEVLRPRVPTSNLFQSFIWQRAGWEVVTPNARLRLLSVWRGAALIGVAPMCLTPVWS